MTATLLLVIESDRKSFEKVTNKGEKSSKANFSFLCSKLQSKITHVSHTSTDGKNSHELKVNSYDAKYNTKYFYFLFEKSPEHNEEAETLGAKYKNQTVLGVFVSNFDFDKTNEMHGQTIQTCSLLLRNSKTLSFSDFEDINHSSKIALEARKFCWLNKQRFFFKDAILQQQVVSLIMLQFLAEFYEQELTWRIDEGIDLLARLRNRDDEAPIELQNFLFTCAARDLETITLYPVVGGARQAKYFWQKIRSMSEFSGRHQEHLEQLSMITELSKSIISEETYDRDTRFQKRIALLGIPLILVSVFADSADGQQNIMNIFRSPTESILLLMIHIVLASMWWRTRKGTEK